MLFDFPLDLMPLFSGLNKMPHPAAVGGLGSESNIPIGNRSIVGKTWRYYSFHCRHMAVTDDRIPRAWLHFALSSCSIQLSHAWL